MKIIAQIRQILKKQIPNCQIYMISSSGVVKNIEGFYFSLLLF
jgi:hypothetical protein